MRIHCRTSPALIMLARKHTQTPAHVCMLVHTLRMKVVLA